MKGGYVKNDARIDIFHFNLCTPSSGEGKKGIGGSKSARTTHLIFYWKYCFITMLASYS